MQKEKSANRQRKNLTLGSWRTSVSLEEQVWDGLVDVCRREEISLDELCAAVEKRRVNSSRSSALRVFVMTYFRHSAELLEAPDGRRIDAAGDRQSLFPGLLDATLNRFHTEQVATSQTREDAG